MNTGFLRIDNIQQALPTEQTREEAAAQLESVFMGLLVKEMRQSLPEGLFGGGPGTAVYEGLFDEHLAQQLCASGGTGLREAILDTMAADAAKERRS